MASVPDQVAQESIALHSAVARDRSHFAVGGAEDCVGHEIRRQTIARIVSGCLKVVVEKQGCRAGRQFPLDNRSREVPGDVGRPGEEVIVAVSC